MRDGDYTATVTFLGKFFEFTEGVVELRAIRNQGGAYPPAFVSSAAQIISYCQRYDVPGSAVYFGCCTRQPSANRGRREDLWQLIALWADIDCLKLGLDIAVVVIALLSCPLPPSLIVMSGGGLHAYWHLKEPLLAAPAQPGEPDQVREEVEAALRQLAGVFCGDDNACDLPRILRPAGTHNSKLAELRPVTVLWPEGLLTEEDVYIDRRYEFADIVEVLDWLGPVIEAPNQAPNNPPNKGDQTDPFLAFAERYRFKPPLDVEAAIRDMSLGGGETGIHRTQLKVSASLLAAGVPDDDIVRFLLEQTQRAAGLAGERWNWKREEKNLFRMIATWRERLVREGKAPPEEPRVAVTDGKIVQLRPREQPSPGEAEAKEEQPATAAEAAPEFMGFPLNDLGNAMRLLAAHRSVMRYVLNIGWHLWDKRRFAFDPEEKQAQLLAQRTVRDMWIQAFAAKTRNTTDKAHAAIMKFAAQCGNSSRLANMLTEASPHVAIPPDRLDADPWLLNCPNGTIDLRTGVLRPHSQDDLITKLCGTSYVPDAGCPQWEKFLSEIFDGDLDLVAFLQRGLGYSLTGDTREQVLFILFGTGANGKTVLLETVSAIMGDYIKHSPADTWAAKQAGAPTNDIAALVGARFVSVVETERERHLAEALVKQATGGDKLTAKFHYKEYFSYLPQFKLWFATNHKPKIRGSDYAIWRRVMLIPFMVKFVPAEAATEGQKIKDGDLKTKLKSEHPGVLAWMVRGCLEWQKIGLKPPKAVRDATEAYQSSEDNVSGFLAECCYQANRQECAVGLLYAAYEIWCEENDQEALPKRGFGKNLDERGFAPRRGEKGARFRKGLDLIEEIKPQARQREADAKSAG